MPTFIYKVKDDSGRNLHGIISAESARDIKKRVRDPNLFFVSAKQFNRERIFKKKIKLQVLIMFTHRLTSLIEAGVPILQAISILWRQTEDPTIQLVISHMKSQLEEGNKISTSMESFPGIFPTLYRALIRVGESSGVLVTVLRKLSEYLVYKAQVITRTKKALMYPLFVVGFSVLTLILMFVYVVPTFEKVMQKLDVELPFLTYMVFKISATMRSPVFIAGVFITLVAVGLLYMRMQKSPKLKKQFDALLLKIPYFGDILLSLSLSQFTRSLGILLGAGVPISESLDVSTTTTTNEKISDSLKMVKKDVEHGNSLYESFKKVKEFPVMLIEMVGVGETSGMIVPILEKVTSHFDEECDYQINKFLTILEPMLIIFVGGVVIFTLLSIYLPIVSIWQGLSTR